MDPTGAPNDIAHIVQLVLAPVFLIVGMSGLLNVLTSRLARVVDRGRALEATLDGEADADQRRRCVAELKAIDQRMARIHVAVILSTTAALLICLVIVLLFAGQLLAVDLSVVIACLFIVTMTAVIGALGFFLGEITIATRTLRVRTELLDRR